MEKSQSLVNKQPLQLTDHGDTLEVLDTKTKVSVELEKNVWRRILENEEELEKFLYELPENGPPALIDMAPLDVLIANRRGKKVLKRYIRV